MQSDSLTLYALVKPTSRIREITLLAAFNIFLVACAYISITLPFSPVPVTGQTFGILIVAMALGRVRGSAVVGAYLLEGAAGLPVFAGGSAGAAVFAGPTGGYLIGFLAAALITGWLADKGWHRSYLLSLLAMVLGTATIFLCGMTWLSAFVPKDNIVTLGFIPFVPGALAKIAVASAILPAVWKLVHKRENE